MKPVWKYAIAGFVGLIIGFSFASCGQQSGDGVEAESPLRFRFVEGKANHPNRLLEVQINGVILNSPSSGFTGFSEGGVTYGYQVQRLLERISQDDRIKGILLRVSTPGGTVVGSDAIYKALIAYRDKTKKPVIAYVEGLSASGGVMSMVGAEAIYAAPGSLIGSIGVLGPSLTYFDGPVATEGGILGGGITTRNGIQRTTIAAGRGKDLGNPFRRATEEEIAVLRQGVNNLYDNFVRHVATTRKIDEKQIRDQMGALIFDNRTAEKYKLIDGTRSRQEAIAELAKRAKVGEDYQLIRVSESRGILAGLLGEHSLVNRGDQIGKMIERDRCNATTQVALVYFGDVTQLCSRVVSGQ